MIWKIYRLKPKKPDHSKLSEEVSDIIDRMPMTFGRWVATSVVVFTILLFTFGWIIKYPDVVTGKITISSNTAPIKLVANTAGKLHLNKINAQDLVKEGDYIGIIKNPASTKDIIGIFDILNLANLANKNEYHRLKEKLPNQVALGELTMKYYAFLSALNTNCDFLNANIYEKREKSLRDGLAWKEVILQEADDILNTTDDNLEITKKWFEKYASLDKNIFVTYELEVDRSKMEYLSTKQNRQSLQKEVTNIKMQISDDLNSLALLAVEKREKERQLKLELLSSFHDLIDTIKLWEQHYVFKAPFDGKVEFLRFWAEDNFVQAGENVFSVVPKENIILGQMHLPSQGAGKVKIGCKVHIKLSDYPYTEYGSVEGIVKSISLITQQINSGENTIDTYLVLVEMPDGLTTNYGKSLDFKYEIGGVGDIIVNDRRLIERLFDNIKVRIQ